MTWRNTPPVRFVQCACCVYKCLYTTHFGLVIVVIINGWIFDRVNDIHLPIPLGARWLRLRIQIPPVARMPVSCECCVLSGRDLSVRLITRPEESYWVWCVVNECNREASIMRRSWSTMDCFDMKKKRYSRAAPQPIFLRAKMLPLYLKSGIAEAPIIRPFLVEVNWIWLMNLLVYYEHSLLDKCSC